MMHEFSLAAELIAECERLAAGRRVASIRVRRNTAFGEDELRLAFDACAEGTLLDGARLDVDVNARAVECRCGFSGVLGADDVIAHTAVCPSCGELLGTTLGADIELLEIHTADIEGSP